LRPGGPVRLQRREAGTVSPRPVKVNPGWNSVQEVRMVKNSSTLLRLAAWAGVVAPVFFVAVFTVEGALRPEYSPLANYISTLSIGPRGWIQILNFIVLGALLLAFSAAVRAEFPDGKASRWGRILLILLGVLFVISGFFVTDSTGISTVPLTVHGTVHGIAGGIAFLAMPVVIFVYWRRFREDPRWKPFQAVTLALGIVEAAAVLFFSIVGKSDALLLVFGDYIGLIQRTAIVPFMFWLFLFAFRMLRREI
jgi:hypothetical membrane protein